jgi:nuclear pore complex protein Nup85
VMDSQPRMLNSKTQKDFAVAIRRWKERVKAIRIDMENVPESDRADDFHNWWDKLSDIVGILEGRGEVIARVCSDLGLDWKEVVAAWSIFVDPRMRRDELPSVVFLNILFTCSQRCNAGMS